MPLVGHPHPKLGIDIGGVIMNGVREDLSGARPVQEPDSVEGAFEAIARLVQQRFASNVWLISRCEQPNEAVLQDWLERRSFYATTGVTRENTLFCRHPQDKARLAFELGLTHFIDDRPQILAPMLEVVPHLYLFRSRASGSSLPQLDSRIQIVDNWTELLDVLLPTGGGG